MPLAFGSFTEVCETAAMVVCPLVGTEQGVEPTCYSRNVEVGGTLLFQPATCFIHIVALIMTAIMVYHIRTKYTAVGRKEILYFFYLYALDEILAIFLDSAIIPTASNVYPWFAAIYMGCVAATFWCLMLNGFVGFQFAEDGTPVSLWILRLSTLFIWALQFFISIATFKNISGFDPLKPIALWIMTFIFHLLCVVVYVGAQLILVVRTLEDRWPIGDILFGVGFFVIGVVVMLAFSVTICDAVKHYIDGLFFSTLCFLLAVMMVYKYYDSITREDLEFSVGSKAAVWEVKDPLLASAGPAHALHSDDGHASASGKAGPSNYYAASPGGAYPPQGQQGGWGEGRY